MSLKINDLSAFNDNLFIPEVGPWAMDKYHILLHYNNMFATGMKNIFKHRIYIDLFSAAGFAKIRNTKNEYVLTSSLIAQNIKDKYDSYIYCDIDEKCISTLKTRIDRYFPQAQTSYFTGDCNKIVDQILTKLPSPSKDNTVLTFCVVDPFNLCINFDTLKKISKYRVDFLVLLSWMDAARNEYNYIKPDHERVNNFLGTSSWRKEWGNKKLEGEGFCKFLAEEFAKNMIGLGYLEDAFSTMKNIRSSSKNLSLYHLAFFSKHPKGYMFWNRARTNAPSQLSLGF